MGGIADAVSPPHNTKAPTPLSPLPSPTCCDLSAHKRRVPSCTAAFLYCAKLSFVKHSCTPEGWVGRFARVKVVYNAKQAIIKLESSLSHISLPNQHTHVDINCLVLSHCWPCCQAHLCICRAARHQTQTHMSHRAQLVVWEPLQGLPLS